REAARDRPARGEEGRPGAHPRRPVDCDARQALADGVLRHGRQVQGDRLGCRRTDGGGLPPPAERFAPSAEGRTGGGEPGRAGRREAQEVRDQRLGRLRGASRRRDDRRGEDARRPREGGPMILGVLEDLLERPAKQKLAIFGVLMVLVSVIDWQYWYG